MNAQYQLDPTTATDGMFAPLRITANRELIVSVAGGTLESGSSANLTSGTTTVKTGAGTFGRLIVNDPGTTVTATIYDNTSAAGTKLATVKLVAGMNMAYGLAFSTGLTIVLSGAADITVTYS